MKTVLICLIFSFIITGCKSPPRWEALQKLEKGACYHIGNSTYEVIFVGSDGFYARVIFETGMTRIVDPVLLKECNKNENT